MTSSNQNKSEKIIRVKLLKTKDKENFEASRGGEKKYLFLKSKTEG